MLSLDQGLDQGLDLDRNPQSGPGWGLTPTNFPPREAGESLPPSGAGVVGLASHTPVPHCHCATVSSPAVDRDPPPR